MNIVALMGVFNKDFSWYRNLAQDHQLDSDQQLSDL